LKMNFLILVLLFCQAFFCSTNAASHNKILVQEDRTIILNKVIENGKSSNVETDRHMHLDWDRFRQLKSEYDSKFDELICTDPDQLRDMHRELDELSKKVELGWNLKQEQLDDLVDVLHNENYNATGLSTGNEGVDDLCQGLQEYIDKVNHTAWEVEKPELDDHLQEVIDIKIAIDTHPCPCVWGEWSIWSDCSTTCEAGERSRERVILKVAINNGTECEGDHDESEVCNADVCCPVNCVWNLWEEWNACPSGCDQHTTRTRTKAVVAVCNGTDCIGEDFEQKSCFRERELEDEIAVLKQQIDQCQERVCPSSNWQKVEDNCYLVGNQKMNHQQAKQYCQDQSHTSHLAEVISQDIQNEIRSLSLDKSQWYWTGGIRTGQDSWKWEQSGSPLTYQNWFPGQPDHRGGNEDCLHLNRWGQWRWNDIPCSRSDLYPLCQTRTS